MPITIANNFLQWFLNANVSFFSSGFVLKAYQILFFDAKFHSHCPGSIESSPQRTGDVFRLSCPFKKTHIFIYLYYHYHYYIHLLSFSSSCVPVFYMHVKLAMPRLALLYELASLLIHTHRCLMDCNISSSSAWIVSVCGFSVCHPPPPPLFLTEILQRRGLCTACQSPCLLYYSS